MEFKPEDIAKLVLGYLRENKCQTAFCEFLTSSQYLKEHVSNQRKGKYIVTRVNGLSLVDYLAEYAFVYSIVQEHIEASDYYNERGLRTSLAQQLLYLLSSRSAIQSRTSTPIQNDIIHAHREDNTSNSKSTKQPQNIFEPIVNNSFDIINDEISATPIQSLPGNCSTELSFLNSSKNKSTNALPNANRSTDTEADVDSREKSQEMCKEIFTQTFLENADLIEKLADNINKEVSSNFHIGQELYNTAIETIIQRIAKDPIVVNSIEEIIGTGEDETESRTSPDENTLHAQDKAQFNTSKERALLSTPEKHQSPLPSSESIKTRLRSSKKSCLDSADNLPSIEEQNNDVIQSIIVASLSGEKLPLDQESNTNNTGTTTHSTPVPEVVFSEQPYNNLTHTLAGSSNQNQIYVNTVNSGSLLMVQPGVSSTCSNIVSAKNLQVDTTKPYYVIGTQQFGNVIIPQTPFKVSNVITEQEIMAMPTIIVCDNNQQFTSSQPAIVSTPATSISTPQHAPRTIAPRRTVEKAQSLSEYISLYQCNDPSSPIISQLQMEASSPNVKSKLKATTNRSKRKTDKKTQGSITKTCKIQTHSETCTAENYHLLNDKVPDIVERITGEATTSKTEPPQDLDQNSAGNKAIGESMPQIVTPKMMMLQDVKERRSRSTPRNGSHVRQLDFSTPDKWCPVVRRANTSPKGAKTLDNRETPLKAPKSGTSRSIRTSLFKSPELELPVEVPDSSTANSDKENEQNKVDLGSNAVSELTETSISHTVKNVKSCGVNSSWDADLRALAAPTRVEETITQKQKRKRSDEFLKERSNPKKPKENLNKTEEDASKIEMALVGGGENQIEIAETIVTKPAQEDIKNAKSASTRRNRVSTKKAVSANKIIKNDNENQVPTKTTKIDRNIVDNNDASTKISSAEDVTPKLENQQKVISEEDPPEKQYVVINRHVKSRIKKKCNMENSIKKTQIPDEIILTNITKIKSCEILDETKNKLVLSPSKLNANKRSLVEIENRNPVEISLAAKVTSVDTSTSFISPELVKSSTTIPPVMAKRMPILETPVKFESVIFPKTPSISSPPTIDTPFTKAVLDQLTGVDINTIPTPKFPITPNVPFTPAIGNEQSPFSNRATDYSTSSSYYQPSDTEQNKSLEQLIEECRQLDSQSVESPKKVNRFDGTLTSSISTCKNSQRLEISGATNKTEINELLNASNSPEVTNTSVTDKMKAFNHSMIGKKNLQLVKMFSNEADEDESSSSSSSSTGTSTTSSSDDSDSSDSDSAVKTMPVKTNTPPYSLRSSKKLATNNISANVDLSREAEKCQNSSLDKDQHSAKSKEKSLSFQDGLLQEMEEKRQRTIARFKTANSITKTKDSSKQKKQTPKSKNSGRRIAKNDDSSKLLKSTPKKVSPSKVKGKKSSPPKDNSNACVVNKSSNSEPNNQSDKRAKELKLSETSTQENESFTILKQVHQLNPTRTSFVSTKNAQATVNDEKEIILHLSSDDENLEPSKLVEAVLLECSTSSTSGGGENVVTSVQYASARSASTFDNVLDVKSTVNEQEAQGTLDQEAETWAKLNGLMQMGIHLIPNKSTKKFVMPPEETEQPNMQRKENISEKADQPAISATEEMPSHSQTKNSPRKVTEEKLEKSAVNKNKIKNAEKTGASTKKTEIFDKLATSKEKTKNADKPGTAKQKTKNLEKASVSKPKCVNILNRSVEEGEIVSDDDKNPKKKNKLKKLKPDNIKRVEPKTTSNAFRNRLRDFREFYKYRPHSETQSKEPVSASTSKIKNLSSSKNSKLDENKIPNKNTKPHNKAPEKIIEIKPKTELTNITEKQTVVNELDYQMQFDNKTYTEETFRVTHDYSKEINRTMSDYNLDILTKKFSANVYIAEIDSEVEKFLTFTPFQFLLDISPKVFAEKKPGVSTKTNKSHVPKEQFKNKKKPLNILYNQLVKAAIETPRASLLEDLYAPEATSRDYKRSSEMSREKVFSRSRKSEKSEKSSRSKQKSSDEEKSHNKSSENTAKYKNRRKIEEENSTSSSNKNDINSESNMLSVNQESTSGDSIVNNDQGTKHLPQGLEQNLEVVDGVIMLNASKEEQKKIEFETSSEVNDELMNYALVGSDRVEDNDDLLITDNRKRKVEEEGENQQEKKQKTEELLRNIDVDSFLKKLHGEM